MGSTHRKTQFFLDWLVELFRTERLFQLSVAVGALVLVISLVTCSSINRERANEASRIKQEERAKLEHRQAAQRKAALGDSLFRYPNSSNPDAIVLGVDPRELPNNLQDKLKTEIISYLEKQLPKRQVMFDVLLPEFYSAGYFSKVFEGDVSVLNTYTFFDHVPDLLLIKPRVEFGTSENFSDMKTCVITLTCRRYSDGVSPGKETSLSQKATGFSKEAAITRAFELLSENKDATSKFATMFDNAL